jgi:hypothetical protein
MFNSPKSSSTIEIQGCLYDFQTPNSNINIKFFQSGVGTNVPNGIEFLKYLKPVRELLETTQIKDIRQLVQRELDDVRIIKSLIPYILNENNILGENGIAFFPSVLGVLMPKDYLNSLQIPYPSLDIAKSEKTKDYKIDSYYNNEFNWSVKTYFDQNENELSFSSLIIDRDKSDIVIIDGQHRINAFRAACDSLTTDNDVVKQIYESCSKYPNDTKANLPVTLIWFEKKDSTQNINISPEIISRRLFIDVNNSAKSIATSRKILLDDRNPINLITNHFYSKVAEINGYSVSTLSLAHLGFDVPSETSEQGSFSAIPFTYITTPDRIKNVFDFFFARPKSYSIRIGKKTLNARKSSYSASVKSENTSTTELNVMLPLSSTSCISQYLDEYLDTKILYVSDDVTESGDTKQEIVRNEFYDIYYNCIYKLFNDFRYFKVYMDYLNDFSNHITESGDLYEKETWKSVFLDGKSLFFTLKNTSQSENKFSKALKQIEDDFIKEYLSNSYKTFVLDENLDEKQLFNSFRTLVFQIGYIQSFYEYCKIIRNCNFETISSSELIEYCEEFLEKVNKIENKEWANYFLFVNKLQGEKHPKYFPVITHLILRKIQSEGTIFDTDDNKYFSPECFYYHEKSVESIDKIIIEDFGTIEIQSMKIDELWNKTKDDKTYGEIFEAIITSKKHETEQIFSEYLNIQTTYLDDLKERLFEDIKKSLKVK